MGKLELPPPLARLARALAAVFEADAAWAAPVHHHRNGWGEFVFRAYWLDGADTEPPLVGIRINRQEPLPVRLLRRMERLPLSERQIEVSLHLACGHTYTAIAERLGLTRSTAIYHAQEAFNKLGVASRAELQAKLMVL
jgi:DNA-binding CsgD family transcriptional regulator